MSILSALKQNSSSIDDLAKLPQAMIMQMAQKKSISADMVAPILARKAEMMDAVARTKTLQQPDQAPPSVLEQLMAKNAGIESPMQAPMPQSPAEIGVGQLPVPERQYAGGGIVAFKQGDLVDLEDDMDDEDLIAEYADAMKAGEMAMMQAAAQGNVPQGNAGMRYTEPMPSGASKGIAYKGGNHPYEGLVMAKAKEFGVDPKLAAYILNKETGGLKNPETARSSAGAMGIAQFMPATAKQYGINPDIPEEAAMGMGKHLRYLMDKYDDPKVAAIAYNWGEGNTNKWLKAGADMNKLPKETKKYVAQLAEGGEVKHYDGTGPSLVEAKKQREDALKALELAMPDMPSDFTGSLSDYLSNPERAALYGKNEKERNIARKAIMYNNPLPTLGRDILNPSASMKSSAVMSKAGKAQLQDIDEASRLAMPPVTVKGSGNYIPNDNPDLDNRDVGIRANAPVVNTGAQAKTPEESFYDKLMKQMSQERADLVKQKTEDRNMALLAAGLGMLGGTSSNAFTNIGQGGLSGVSYLSDANKQRAAQAAALNKNELTAQRYKDLSEISQGNQAGLMALKAGELSVRQGTLANEQKKVLENSLQRMDTSAAASANAWIKANPMAGFSLENAGDVAQIKYQILAKDPRYQSVYRQLEGTDFVVPNLGTTSGGTLAEQAKAQLEANAKAKKDKEKK
jgi:hypothetical protein